MTGIAGLSQSLRAAEHDALGAAIEEWTARGNLPPLVGAGLAALVRAPTDSLNK